MKLIIKTTLILLIAILQSCANPETKINGNISEENRAEIKMVNDQLLFAIKNNDVIELKKLLSDSLKKTASDEQLTEMISQLGKTYFDNKYEIMSEFHISNSLVNENIILTSETSTGNGYKVRFTALNKEMYVSLLLSENNIKSEMLSTIIYGKYGNEWKVNILRFGVYGFLEKNAIDYYNLAMKEYADSNIADAANAITLAKECLKPANDFFEYDKEKEINTFYKQVIDEANTQYHFPIVLENIETKPSIFKIYPEVVKEGFFPTVCYKSKISLEDTVALHAENDLIKKQIGTIFKGIDKGKKYVYYKAINEFAKEGEQIKTYGFVDEIMK